MPRLPKMAKAPTHTKGIKIMRKIALVALLFGIFLSQAGCSKPWRIILRTEPNPFGGNPSFFAMDLNYNNLRVGSNTEAGHLSKKTPKQRQKWDDDKRMMNIKYADSLRNAAGFQVTAGGAPQAGQFIIQANIEFIEPGFYIGIAHRPSTVRMRVKLLKGNKVLDEFEIQSSTSPVPRRSGFSIGGSGIPTKITVGSRLMSDAGRLGRLTARYIAHRLSGK